MEGNATSLAVVGILATSVGALVWIIKYLFSEFMPVMKELQKSTQQNTAATKSADQYLRQRNGIDLKHHEQSLKAIAKIPLTLKSIADAQSEAIIRAVSDQKVEHQTVTHQVVDERIDLTEPRQPKKERRKKGVSQ